MSEVQPPMYSAPQKKRSKWWVPVLIVGGVFIGFAVLIVAIAAGVGAGIGSALSGMSKEEKTVKITDNSVLYLNLSKGVEEYTNKEAIFNDDNSVALLDVLNAIKAAKNDSKIKGMYIKGGTATGFAKQREIGRAISDFKKSGKWVYAWIDGGAERDYYTLAQADSIFMPQESMFEFNGFGSSVAFLKGLFEKLGVEMTVIQREEYKSAGEPYSRTNFSEPAKEEMRAILQQRFSLFVQDVAKFRKLPEDEVVAMLNRGIYDPDSLKSLKLIDGFATDLQMTDMLKRKVFGSDSTDKKLNLVAADDYARSLRGKSADLVKDKAIAIVYGSGAIRGGRTAAGGKEIASGSFVRELRKAREDDEVKAIIIRIDSPGGSVDASDEIFHEIQKAKKVKPVYASMSDVAASGGYYMAMACDTIIAHRETITGSIGVIASIPNFKGTYDKLGITLDTITTGKASLDMDFSMPMTAEKKVKYEAMIESFYQRFLERVAQSRHSTPEKIREVARGRVWTGEAAKEKGLVDVIGGLQESIDIVKRRIGVAADKRIKIKTYPESEDALKSILRMFGKEVDDDDEASLDEVKAQAQKDRAAIVSTFVAQQNPAWQTAWKSLPQSVRAQLEYAIVMHNLSAERHALMAMPYLISIE